MLWASRARVAEHQKDGRRHVLMLLDGQGGVGLQYRDRPAPFDVPIFEGIEFDPTNEARGGVPAHGADRHLVPENRQVIVGGPAQGHVKPRILNRRFRMKEIVPRCPRQSFIDLTRPPGLAAGTETQDPKREDRRPTLRYGSIAPTHRVAWEQLVHRFPRRHCPCGYHVRPGIVWESNSRRLAVYAWRSTATRATARRTSSISAHGSV